MEEEWLEGKKLWLFDLAHSDLDNGAIISGFLKYYVLQDQGISDVKRDLHFRTYYGDLHLDEAITGLRQALETQI